MASQSNRIVVTVKWRGEEHAIHVPEHVSLLDFKVELAQITGVPVEKQLLIGLRANMLKEKKDLASESGILLHTVLGKVNKVTLMGESIRDAEMQLKPSEEELASVVNDLDAPVTSDLPNRDDDDHTDSYYRRMTRVPRARPRGQGFSAFTASSSSAPISTTYDMPMTSSFSDDAIASQFSHPPSSPSAPSISVPTKEELEALMPDESQAVEFLSFFESEFGPSHPHFHQGSFASTISTAKTQRRLMVLYLHSDSEPHRSFCRTVLASSAVAEYLDENFVTTATVVPESGQQQWVRQARAKPALLVLANSGSTVSLVVYVDWSSDQGSPDDVLVRLLEVHEAYGFMAVPKEDAELQAIMREQDMDYEASLVEDRRRQSEAEAREREGLETRRREEAAERERQRALGDIQRRITPEPAEGSPDATNLRLTLPDGSRLQRRFLLDEPVQRVVDFVMSSSERLHPVQLVTTFPRTVLDDVQRSLRQYGLGRQANLIVEFVS